MEVEDMLMLMGHNDINHDHLSVSCVLGQLLEEQSVVQLVMKFGATQEVKEDTLFLPHKDCVELVHAGQGRTVIMYDSILFINTVPIGREPPSWKR